MINIFYLLIITSVVLNVSTLSVSENVIELVNSNDKILELQSPSKSLPTQSLENAEVCSETDRIEIFRDSNDCDKYYISCFLNSSLEPLESSTTIAYLPKPMTPYKTQSRRCSKGLLFDEIELKCLSAAQVDCTPFKCPEPTNSSTKLLPDAKRPSFFIECRQGINPRRQECQPSGTIFDKETQTCVKPPKVPEPISISLLRFLIKFMESTRDMSPWMEVVQMNATAPSGSIIKSFNTSSDQLYVDTIDEPPSLVTNDSYIYEDDEMEVFTQDTKLVVLYYFVMFGVALTFILLFISISAIFSKIFVKTEDNEDAEPSEEFYRYNQNDKYLMTRL